MATYLLGVALFSISFLVFLNASVSFVITDIIGKSTGVGDAVGSLGFADELVALIACPVWGLLSDKMGVRYVCVSGYAIIGISLFLFVHARNVYPQLLLGRILFSLGGAATSTMVTAVLPTMTLGLKAAADVDATPPPPRYNDDIHDPSLSHASEATRNTATPIRDQVPSAHSQTKTPDKPKSATSQVAGLVGSFTGLGALLALGIFLPLPARFGEAGYDRATALTSSFYVVGAIALAVGLFCLFGLRNLPGEESKGLHALVSGGSLEPAAYRPNLLHKPAPSISRLTQSLKLGFTDMSIGLGYLGGFVARASSVGISLFIPLFVNFYFSRTGLCPINDVPSDPSSDIKAHCREAYKLAGALSGVSQAVALLCAPIFGWLDGRFGQHFNAPLLVAAVAGVVGYVALGQVEKPDSGGGVWVCMVLLGISQIGAIVCSLSSLSRGIEAEEVEAEVEDTENAEDYWSEEEVDRREEQQDVADEQASLIPSHLQQAPRGRDSARTHLKGTIAGIYSLSGGAGILLLTKLGGYLFDELSPGAPFYMLAIFNAILLAVTAICTIGAEIRRRRSALALS